MPDAAPNEAENVDPPSINCDTPEVGSESEGIRRINAAALGLASLGRRLPSALSFQRLIAAWSLARVTARRTQCH